MNVEQIRAAFEAWGESVGFCVTGKYAETVDVLCAESAFKAGYKAALQSQDREGWKEAAIAWEVCASLHREYCKGKDPFYKTRQADFVKHAEASREKALRPCSTEDKTDAEPEFPSGSELDAAIDHARLAGAPGERSPSFT